MCVIAHTKLKKNMPRANVVQCMTANNSGFFLADLKADGTRSTLRTLDMNSALAFFDKIPDGDEFVLHARIPSYGAKTLENVHGWEEDGILFCHNMSIRVLDDMMKADKWDKTDSEYFFRHVFMPLFKAFGTEAYKDGAFHPYITKIVKFFAGTSNRFLFIMPDNVVLKFGCGWVKDFQDTCEFSNSSYRIPTSTFGGNASTKYADDDDYLDWFSRSKTGGLGGYKPPTTKCDGKTFRTHMGDKVLLKYALYDIVVRNMIEAKTALPDLNTAQATALSDKLWETAPELMDEHGKESGDILQVMSGDTIPQTDYDDVMLAFAASLESKYLKNSMRYTSNVWPSDVKAAMSIMEDDMAVACQMLNVSFNFETKNPLASVAGYIMEPTKSGGIKPVKLGLEDLVCPLEFECEMAKKAVCNMLKIINEPEKPETVSTDPEKKETVSV